MRIKAASPMMLTLLLIGMLTWTFNVQVLEANPIPVPSLWMPKEYIDAKISLVDSVVRARVNGTYPFGLIGESLDQVIMYYPVPPDADKTTVEMDEAKLDWIYSNKTYPTALGNWPMINWTVKPVPECFEIKTYYEHLLPMIGGNYTFLYAMGTGRYLDYYAKETTAYVTASISKDVAPSESYINVYTITEEGMWKSADYTMVQEDEAWIVRLTVVSEELHPLEEDLLITIKTHPTTWTVDDDGPADFSSIQEAINVANDGDTIFVYSGIYYENVVVNKTVSLIGENRSGTIIDGNSTGNVVEVTASNVTITGFTIQESGAVYRNCGIYIGESSSGNKLSYNIIKNNYDGICLLESSSNSLSRNNITANNHDSIYLYSSSNNIISENNITSNYFGIRLSESSNHNSITRNDITNNDYGIGLTWSSSDNNVSRNDITKNSFGICLSYSSNYNNILENNIANNSHGVWLYVSANNNSIHGNNITAHSVKGIWIEHSSNNSISGNTIANNRSGIWLVESSNSSISKNNIINNLWGINLFDNSNYNSVSGNNVTATHWEGIIVNEYSNHNNISGNNIANNGYGIHLDYYSSNNSISANKITANRGVWLDGYGIQLKSWSSNNSIFGNNIANNVFGIWLLESSNNTIYHDNFTNNTQQVYDESIKYSWASPSINTWDNDYPSGGNYWSDYEERYPDAKELNGSGIWNTPYVIDENNQDRYPLMSPYVPDITPPTTIDDYDDLWHTTDFTITLTATDDMSGVPKTYYKINDGPTKTVSADGQPLITTEGANNTLEYWSIDNAGNEELPHNFLTDIKLDKTAPTGSIIINNGDAYTPSTSVTITFTATDATSGVYQIRYGNDGIWDTEPWEDFSTTKTWTVTPGDGIKTVYYQIKDNAGLVSSYQDTITLDTKNPTANAGQNQTVAENTLVTFDGSASTDENGIARCTWTFIDITPQTLSGENPTYTFTTPGTYVVTLTVEDAAGNTATDTVTITVLLDTDGDGIGNNADDDDDNDGTLDVDDAFPLDPMESVDTDGDGVGDNSDTDDDNDGMPDTWETENELNPLDAADASLDPDGDGLTNLQEYQGDTDPNVSDAEASPMWILGATAMVVIGIAIVTAAFLLRRLK